MARAWLGRGRPKNDGPREQVISTSMGWLRVSECRLCAVDGDERRAAPHVPAHFAVARSISEAGGRTLTRTGWGPLSPPPRRYLLPRPDPITMYHPAGDLLLCVFEGAKRSEH